MVAIVVAGLIALVVVPEHVRLIVTSTALALVVLDAWLHDERLAWWWGLLLAVEVIDDVPDQLLDAARYAGLALLCLRFKPTLSAERRPILLTFVGGAVVVALVRGIASAARFDHFGTRIALMMLVAAVAAPFIAVRVQTHLTIFAGYLGGVLLSSVVALTQAFDLPALREGNQAGSRYPGLSAATSVFTWQLAIALIIATYFLLGRNLPRRHRLTAMAVVPFALVALFVNGAQGGLIGLAAAALAVTAWGWRSIPWRKVLRLVPLALGAVLVLGAAVAISGVKTPTIDGLRGVGGFANERARWDAAIDGWNEMVEHPVTGFGRTAFEQKYDELFPHFLPLEAGVTAGVIGFVTALFLVLLLLWVVLRGPVGRQPTAWLGLALCSAMFANTLLSTGGPLVGLPAFSLLLISVLACRGEPWPDDDRSATPAPADPVPSQPA
jgi:hypothetical protein